MTRQLNTLYSYKCNAQLARHSADWHSAFQLFMARTCSKSLKKYKKQNKTEKKTIKAELTNHKKGYNTGSPTGGQSGANRPAPALDYGYDYECNKIIF